MKKILILGSQHGNEPLGELLYNYLRQHHADLLPAIDYRVGNPRAKKQGVRYIESDLNRSYNGKRTTYEERRATRLLKYIHDQQFTLVIDAHTTVCDQSPCFIASTMTGDAGAFMGACDIEKVVQMHPDIAKTSLIGVCPQAVSIEIQTSTIDDKLLQMLAKGVVNYLRGSQPHHQKMIYQIDSLILKTEISDEEAADLQNFVKSPLGFYPVLIGENSYKKQTNYLGFKAYRVYRTRV